MFAQGGWYRGSSVLLTGTAGTAKTTLAAAFAAETCRRGERCLYFAFEESPAQLIRNMRTVGLDLQPYLDQGLLRIEASRPSLNGLERHLVTLHRDVREFWPHAVVIDPISNLISVGSISEVRSMLTRIIDFLKINNITALFTALISGQHGQLELTEQGVSSLVDTWISVRDLEGIGERNRGLSILKARGMAHSNQVREFIITDHGVELLDVIIGSAGIITGAGRLTQRMQAEAQLAVRQHEADRRDRELEGKRRVLEATIANLRTEFESVEEELRHLGQQEQAREAAQRQGHAALAAGGPPADYSPTPPNARP
ncbi:MAG: ATPase domain-containing protein [Hymenobacter sp.]